MKLGSFRLDLPWRATAAAPKIVDEAPRPRAEIGASGTINLKGFLVDSEYNQKLRWPEGLRVWDQMERSDASVDEALRHIYEPIKNATWRARPPENPTVEELVATELVRRAFFELLHEQPFAEYIDQVLDMLAKGHSVFELPERIVEMEITVDDPAGGYDETGGRKVPKQIVVPTRPWLVWDRMAQRLPDTIWEWHVTDGRLDRITQQVHRDDSYVTVSIPASSLIVFTNRKRGDEFTGRSILRSAYKPWFFKELIEKIEAVSLERWGVGIPIAYPPTDRADDEATIARLELILSKLRGGSFSYVVAPGPKQQASSGDGATQGYLFEILSPTGTPPDFKSAKEYHRAEIKASVLARFAELGHAQTGARSTGDTQSQVWYAALHAVATYIGEKHQAAIKRLVDANVVVSRYPTLVAEDIEAKSLEEFAGATAKLVSAGAVHPDRGFRAFVRRGLDAPMEDDPEASDEAADPADPLVDPMGRPIEPTLTPEEKRAMQEKKAQQPGEAD